MAVILAGGEDPALSRFLRRNLPARLFSESGPALCFSGKDCPELTPGAVLIADSGSALPFRPENIRVISCGRSEKDTFTFSSRGEESGSVALMRDICGLEPLELPVEYPADTGDFPILAAAAALLLTGSLPEGKIRFYPPDEDRENLNK